MTDSKFYRIRERTAKRVVSIVAVVIFATSLGFWVGQSFAYDSSSRTVYGENITNLQSLGTPSNPLDSINTEQIFSGSLNAKRTTGEVARKWNVFNQGTLSFEAVNESIPSTFATGAADPILLHKSFFDDGQYRLLFRVGGTKLWKTSDFSNFTKISDDLIDGEGDYTELADAIVLPNGKFALYTNPSSPDETNVWTGNSLTNLSKVGKVFDKIDTGVFLDENNTVHLYPQPAGTEQSADVIEHWTTPWDDLTNATQHDNALDVSGDAWAGAGAGDVEFIELGGTVYMTFDIKNGNLNGYRVGLAYSDNLYDWNVIEKTGLNRETSGGDMTMVKYGNVLKGATEYTADPDVSGPCELGIWTLHPLVNEMYVGGEVRLQSGANDRDHLSIYSDNIGDEICVFDKNGLLDMKDYSIVNINNLTGSFGLIGVGSGTAFDIRANNAPLRIIQETNDTLSIESLDSGGNLVNRIEVESGEDNSIISFKNSDIRLNTNWIDARYLKGGLVEFLGMEQNGDASSPTTAYDSSPQGNDGTINGADWVVDSERGVCLDFVSANNDDVVVTDDASLKPSTFTISVWLKGAFSSDWTHMINKDNGTDGFSLQVSGADGTLRAQLRSDGTEFRKELSVIQNEWNHVVMQFDGSNLIIYVNGQKVDSISASLTHTTQDLYLGQRGGGLQYWDGEMDSFRMYNRVLSSEEIKALYNGLGNKPTGHLALK